MGSAHPAVRTLAWSPSPVARIPGWTAHNGAQVTFERWSNGAWHSLATKHVRQGKAVHPLSHSGTGKYRVEVAATPDIWDCHSRRVSR